MTSKKLTRFTQTALLAALTFLLGLTPLGLIPLGFINVTILCVPVIVGALVLGPKVGLLLGACFGTASLLSAVNAPSALVAPLMQSNVFLVVVMCYAPRLTVPLCAYGMSRLLSGRINDTLRYAASAAAGSITNTVLYLGLMLLFYTVSGLDSAGILALVGGVGLIAGGAEALVAALVVSPVTMALNRFNKRANV